MVDNSTDNLFQQAFENASIPEPSEERWAEISEHAVFANGKSAGISHGAKTGLFIALLVIGSGTAAYLYDSEHSVDTLNAMPPSASQTNIQFVASGLNDEGNNIVSISTEQEVQEEFFISDESTPNLERATQPRTEIFVSEEGLNGVVPKGISNDKNLVTEEAPDNWSEVNRAFPLSGNGSKKIQVKQRVSNNSVVARVSNNQATTRGRVALPASSRVSNQSSKSKSKNAELDFRAQFIKSDPLAKLLVLERNENGPWLNPASPKSKSSSMIETSSGSGVSGFQLLPYYSFDHELNNYTIANRYQSEDLKIEEDRSLAYSLGMRGRYVFKRRFNADFGLYYVNKGTLSGVLSGLDESLFTEIQIESQYLEIPISVGYRMPFEGFGISFNLGTHLRKNLGSENSVIVEQDLTNDNVISIATNSGSMGLGLLTSIAVDFRVSRNLSFFVEPAYRHALNDMILIDESSDYELPFNAQLSTFSLGTGLIISLN